MDDTPDTSTPSPSQDAPSISMDEIFGSDTATPTETPQPETTPVAEPPQPTEAEPTPESTETPVETPSETKKLGTVLDDVQDEEGEQDASDSATDDAEPNPDDEEQATDEEASEDDGEEEDFVPDPEAVEKAWSKSAELLKKLPDLDVGHDIYNNKVTIKGEDLAAAVTVLKAKGVDPSELGTIMSCHAAIEAEKLHKQNTQDQIIIQRMAEECHAYFGDEFNRAVRNTRKAMAMMDPRLAEDLSSQPLFMNNYRFIQFLSDIGERLGNDHGVSSSARSGTRSHGFDVSQLLPSGNR